MSKTKSILVSAGLVLLIFISTTAFRKFLAKDPGTSISISENNRELSIRASFPEEKSANVQQYLKRQLKLSDLPDLSDLEVKNYRTPDGIMAVYIKSMDGFVTIRMNKNLNSSDAYDKLKETGEGLKAVLAH